MNELVIKILSTTEDNNIAIWSLIISICALIVTIIFNIITHQQYVDSLEPLLSFKLYRESNLLLLNISNKGKSAAEHIKLRIVDLIDNGKSNTLCPDNIFDNEFELYPEESIQVLIATSINALGENIFPKLKISIEYIKGNTKKKIKYDRVITNTRTMEEKVDLNKIENSLESISLSNNRLANYIDGHFLTAFDRLNIMPKSSLYKDFKNIIKSKNNNLKNNKK